MGNKISNQLQKGKSQFERLFFCPGCKNAHGFRSKDWPEPKGLSNKEKKFFENKWVWDGNYEKPTITPSIHVQREIGTDENNNTIYETLCHSNIKGGKIQFLNDCKHGLKNQTVELEDF